MGRQIGMVAALLLAGCMGGGTFTPTFSYHLGTLSVNDNQPASPLDKKAGIFGDDTSAQGPTNPCGTANALAGQFQLSVGGASSKAAVLVPTKDGKVILGYADGDALKYYQVGTFDVPAGLDFKADSTTKLTLHLDPTLAFKRDNGAATYGGACSPTATIAALPAETPAPTPIDR